jgi:hypothetical protein
MYHNQGVPISYFEVDPPGADPGTDQNLVGAKTTYFKKLHFKR